MNDELDSLPDMFQSIGDRSAPFARAACIALICAKRAEKGTA